MLVSRRFQRAQHPPNPARNAMQMPRTHLLWLAEANLSAVDGRASSGRPSRLEFKFVETLFAPARRVLGIRIPRRRLAGVNISLSTSERHSNDH